VILSYHRATHVHQRPSQRIECANVEFGCEIKASGCDRACGRQHPVAAHEFTGVLLADQQVLAVLIESIDIRTPSAVGIGSLPQRKTGFTAEHVVAQSLRGPDQLGLGGQQQRIARLIAPPPRDTVRLVRGNQNGQGAHATNVAQPFGGSASAL
jgi:hypothetical protein